MTEPSYRLANLDAFVDRELGVSPWLPIDQARIDAFAACTEDRQWLHVDAARARRESPFGATVAHGLLTLSLLPKFADEVGIVPEGVRAIVNYGYDRVRFIAPVRVGARVRDRITLRGLQRAEEGRVVVRFEHVIELEGEQKPALVAVALLLFLP